VVKRSKEDKAMPITIKGIEVVAEAKYLGVTIDNRLLFNE
jgi:hypothetical protein